MKSKERTKMFSTVWTVFIWLFLFVAVFGEHTEVVLIVLLGLGLMTLLATFMITQAGIPNETNDSPSITSKSKRSDTALVDRLLESMSEGEMAALRRRLMGDISVIGSDGELVPLDELKAGDNSSSH